MQPSIALGVFAKRKRQRVVGAGGFEPPAFWSQTRRATKLRYAPSPAGYALSKTEATKPRSAVAAPKRLTANDGLYPSPFPVSTVRPGDTLFHVNARSAG